MIAIPIIRFRIVLFFLLLCIWVVSPQSPSVAPSVAPTFGPTSARSSLYNIGTYAGVGTSSSTGSNGKATSAGLNAPVAVFFDASSNSYIAENSCIRRVTSDFIYDFAGSLTSTGSTGDSGAATSALLSVPKSITMDQSGALYIADFSNNKIRKVSNGVITVFAGTGTNSETGDGGPATSATFNGPHSVWTDTNDNLYVADYNGHACRLINAGGTVTAFAGMN